MSKGRGNKGDVVSEEYDIAEDLEIERARLCSISDDYTSLATFVPLRRKIDTNSGGKIVQTEDFELGVVIFYVRKGGDKVEHVRHIDGKSWLKFGSKIYYMNAPMCEVNTMPSSRVLFKAEKPPENGPTDYSEDFGEYLNSKVVLNEIGLLEYLSLWVLGTHLFDAFMSYPYGWVHGVWKSGKSTLIETCAYGSFYGKFVTDLTPANIYRLVDSTGSALCIDEGEDLFKTYGGSKRSDDAQRVVSLLNSGYKEGAVVPRADTETGLVVDYRTFSPKMFASVNQIDHTLSSRSTTIQTTRLPNADKPVKPYFSDLTEFRNKMYVYRLFWGSKIKIDYRNFLQGGATEKYQLKQRIGELFLPVVFLCLKFRPEWLPNLMIFIKNQETLKIMQTESSIDSVVMNILREFVALEEAGLDPKEKKKNKIWMKMADIKSLLQKTEFHDVSDRTLANVMSRLGFTATKKTNGIMVREIDPKKITTL